MRGPHNLWRLVRTGATMTRTGAMRQVLDALDAPVAIRVGARILGWPFAWLGFRGDPSLPPVARALTAMGPAYIKFGQILSTRPDVAGPVLAEQLTLLQDKLPPFSLERARRTISSELGVLADELFSEISEPVAAASIAQVHRAVRKDTGETVAIKVLRPGIERAFRRDIDAFYFVASVIERLSPASRRLRPRDVIAHFEGVVMNELDLRMEAAAAAEFASSAKDDAGFTVPGVVWSLSARRVLTLDWCSGIPIGRVSDIEKAGHDKVALGARVLEVFLRHALRDGFFHADMHQGNLMVAENGDIVALDFGIMGRIDDYTRRVYAEILYGFIKRDYRRVAEVHFEAGYVPADRDVDAFARALRAVGEPIFGMQASQISMGRLLQYLFEVTDRFGMSTRTELILLQRTMVVVEGVARSLDPDINIWSVARPVVEDYIRENIGPRALVRDLVKTATVLSRFGPRLPLIVEELLQRQDGRTVVEPSPRPNRAGWFVSGGVFVALVIWLVGAI